MLCLAAPFFTIPRLFLFSISHIFDKTITTLQKEGYYSYSSQPNKQTIYVYSSHARVNSILMAMDQKDRSYERIAAHINYPEAYFPTIQ